MAQKSELEQFLKESSKYLKLDLGLERPKSSISFCSEHEWRNLERQGISGIAFYDPKTEKVYLSPEASIADLVHEYFGHALYSEQSLLGKKFKQAIQKNIDNEQARKETKEFFDKITPLQEGFSLWMEEKILKQLGLTSLWKDRYHILAKSPYLNFYNSFLKEESEKGAITLLYKLGLPKSKDKEIIKKVAKENLKDFNSIIHLVQYGSLERDIDLLAVYPDEAISKNGLVYNGCVDINILNETSFSQRLKLYDIEVLEPMLTGNILIGDKKSFENLKSGIRTGQPSDQAVEYANKRSLETFNSALWFYNQNRFKCNEALLNANNSEKIAATILKGETSSLCSENLLYALNNLSFSLSYKLSADHYSKEKSFTQFKDLIKNPLLESVVKYIKDVENCRENLSEDKTSELLTRTKNFLLKQFHPS